MSLIFVAANLIPTAWERLSFKTRVSLVRRHYIERPEWAGIVEREWYFPEAGLGIYAAYQKMNGKKFSHESSRGHTTDLITHAPFGLRYFDCSTPPSEAPSLLASVLETRPDAIANIPPAQTIVSIDEKNQCFTLRNDLLGLAKTYVLDTPEGCIVASRPIAAHLFGAIKPELSPEGWSTNLLYGWFLRQLTPFKRTRKLPGGTVILMNGRDIKEDRRTYPSHWFTQPSLHSMFDGFDRYINEFKEFAEPSELDVALSGGRDSRGSAALFSAHLSESIRFRTNEPPALEGIVARRLIERLPIFHSFDDDRLHATDATGRQIWKAHTPRVSEIDVEARARQWAYVSEGMISPAAIYGAPPRGPVFSAFSRFMPSISGAAGECAKAYYWSQEMVSGAYAVSLERFRLNITTVPISERMKDHPLTKHKHLPFISEELHRIQPNLIAEAKAEAEAHGVHGYRFFDYWWLTDRFAMGTAYMGSETVTPFTVPEYISEALQRPAMERTRGQALAQMVARYRPEWSDVAYFDELQNEVPKEQLRAYRQRSILWEGDLADWFFSLLRDSPAMADYNKAELVAYFRSLGDDQAKRQVSNLLALGLVQKHAVNALCDDIGTNISGISGN